MRLVLDTNVLVAALLTPHGPPAQLLRLALLEEITLLHDPRILAEYREVLARSRFGFDPAEVALLLRQLELGGAGVVALPLPVELPDPGDLPFLEVASTAGARALVTGNARHFHPVRGSHEVTVLTPQEALRELARRR